MRIDRVSNFYNDGSVTSIKWVRIDRVSNLYNVGSVTSIKWVRIDRVSNFYKVTDAAKQDQGYVKMVMS